MEIAEFTRRSCSMWCRLIGVKRGESSDLSQFEEFAGQRRLLNGSAALALAADSGVDYSDGSDCRSNSAEGSGPPREPHEIDSHLERKKRSHAQEAGTEKTDLRDLGGVELPVRNLPKAGPARYDALRMELNPASSHGDGRAEGYEYPIQKNHSGNQCCGSAQNL
jgi:hypothetical protein